RQETWRIGLWTALGNLAGFATVLWAVHAAWSLRSFVLATALINTVANLGLALRLWRTRSASAPGPALAARELVRESAFFLMPQVGAAFIGVFLPTLVAFFAGAGAVAAFSVLQRLFGLVLQLQMLSLQPTWPAYTHAAERRDAPAARKLFRGSLLATLGVA